MPNYVAIMFDSDAKAWEGLKALWALNREGNITVHAAAVIRRDAHGNVHVEKNQSIPGLRTAAGAAIG